MDGAITLLLVVGAICLVVVAWAGRKRFPLRIGAGNFFRRKTQVAIVVAGLLIGTAIITSSYVIQSTFDYTVKAAVFRALDAVDEVVFVPSPEGGRLPFSAQVYDNLTTHLADMPDVAGLAPRYQLPGAVVDTTSQLFEPTATVIGFDSGRDLGDFVRANGSAWNGAGLGATEAIINTKLATAVEAKVGQGLVVSMGTPRGNAQMSVTVKEIVRDEGRGAWNDNENLFVPLSTIQTALGEAGQINTVTVANVGGVTQGYLRSDDVVREMAPFLPSPPTFTISKAKADSIDGATRNIDQLSQVFVLLGFFTVIAGVLLIINIFVMLAEERKGEMGVARALGMRDIPEPVPHRSTRRQVAGGAAIAVLGALGFVVALLRQNLLLQDLGPVGLAFGVAVLTMRAVPARAVFTAAGAFIVGWVLSPWKFFSIANADITLFIAAGLMLVLGGLLIVLFNSDSILAVATRLVRGRTWRPVVRTAIAYPMNKKFRTGATLASIALVMFTIATMSGIQAEVSSSITTTSQRESGGFELLGASGVPVPNWDAAFAAYNATSTNVTENHGIAQARVRIASNANLSGIQHNSSLTGVPASWTPPFPLQARDPAYADDAAAWAAIRDPDLAIIDGTVVPNNFGPNFGSFTAKVDDVFHFRNMTGVTRSVRIIGILYEQFAQGLWVSSSSVKADFGIDAASLFYFNLRPAVDVTQAGHDLGRDFIAYQLITGDIQSGINSILQTTMGGFHLLPTYPALGLS